MRQLGTAKNHTNRRCLYFIFGNSKKKDTVVTRLHRSSVCNVLLLYIRNNVHDLIIWNVIITLFNWIPIGKVGSNEHHSNIPSSGKVSIDPDS